MRHKALISIAGGILLAVIVGGVTAAATASPFAGRWTSTDVPDGSSQVLLISTGAAPSVVYQDYYASSCAANGPTTHWLAAGRGELDGDTLYVHFHKSGCGRFSIGQYDDWWVYDAGNDTLTDSFGIVWQRKP